MSREPRFDRLFEPIQLGPVVAPNRFYQVPHCSGMGYAMPRALTGMRKMKAEGGWGVVCTEYCSIDPSADDHPWPFLTIWDEGDVKNLTAMASAIHNHGSLAGIELWHGGIRGSNLLTRATPMAPLSWPTDKAPIQTRRMDVTDLRDYRRAHRAAALKAKAADFDIVYVYAAHGYLLSQFLDGRQSRGVEGYSGSLESRVRIIRELIADTKEAIGDRCAVALRIEADDETQADEPGRRERMAIFEILKRDPDLFDVTVSDPALEMGLSRFHKEASLEDAVSFVRRIVERPIVSVGRFTSPETMLDQLTRGVMDLIGAARPSIADPFLPKKISEGRLDDIRECIGCNICLASDVQGVPLRCTQNPTMGEEWRLGWHPEFVDKAEDQHRVLIVGAGPAGLEAALTLGRAGHHVMLAEARRELGGRVTLESKLPGLSEWARVRDYRTHQIGKLPNVEVFRESRLSAADIYAIAPTHVLIATGSQWRADGMGRQFPAGNLSFDRPLVLTPDELMAGRRPFMSTDHPTLPVIVYDDDHYVIGAVVAELLAREGYRVVYVTPAGLVGAWSRHTSEQASSQARLLELGVEVRVSHDVLSISGADYWAAKASVRSVFRGPVLDIACGCLVPVTSREPDDALWRELMSDASALFGAGISSVERIGDCKAPGLIAHAVYDGHRAARILGKDVADSVGRYLPFGRERIVV